MRVFMVLIIIFYIHAFFSPSMTHGAAFGNENRPINTKSWQPYFNHHEHGGQQERPSGLPDTFQAPSIESIDFWKHHYDTKNFQRKIFFDNFNRQPYQESYFPGYSTVRQVMNKLFGQSEYRPKPVLEPYQYEEHSKTQEEPYSFKHTYGYKSTEPTPLPPPKPLRASIVKLTPDINSGLDYQATAKYYPHFVNLVNQVLLENTRSNDQAIDSGIRRPYFEEENTSRERLKDTHKFYKQYENITPTTYKPISNTTALRYPESIQDQLPPLTHGQDARIPYVSAATTIDHPVTTTEKFYSATYHINPRNGKGKGYNRTDSVNNTRETTSNLTVDGPKATTGTITNAVTPKESILFGASTEMKGIIHSPPKQYSSSKNLKKVVNNSIEQITDLTVRGWLKNQEPSSVPKYNNRFDMSTLIDYEMKKLRQGSIEPRTNPRRVHTVDVNDELSLDVKILKDTKWDGFTVTANPTTTTQNDIETYNDAIRNSTVVVETRVTKSISKKVNGRVQVSPIQKENSTDPSTKAVKKPVPYHKKRLPHSSHSVTRLGLDDGKIISPLSNRQTLSVNYTLIPSAGAPPKVKHNGIEKKISARRRMGKPNFEEKYDIAAFITESTTVAYDGKKKYNRRYKVTNFTRPYSADRRKIKVKVTQLGRKDATDSNQTISSGNKII